MIFDDCERIAGDCVGDRIDIREDRTERCGKNGDAAATVGEITLTKKRAGDAVGYRIHLWVEEEKIVHDWAKAQKISMSGWRLGTTSPMIRAGMPRRSIAARAEFAAPGASATSRPPDVCGSKSNARNPSATLSLTSTQLSTNSRLFFMPPEKKPAREASIAPGKYSMRSWSIFRDTPLPMAISRAWPRTPKPVTSVTA